MVVTDPSQSERESDQTQSPKHDYLYGCINMGWGARLEEATTGGAFHIKCLELLGAWYATQALVQEKENLIILLWIDNRSAVAYTNNMGGTHSCLWALKKGIIFLIAKHIAGKDNVSADWMSHAHQD